MDEWMNEWFDSIENWDEDEKKAFLEERKKKIDKKSKTN